MRLRRCGLRNVIYLLEGSLSLDACDPPPLLSRPLRMPRFRRPYKASLHWDSGTGISLSLPRGFGGGINE